MTSDDPMPSTVDEKRPEWEDLDARYRGVPVPPRVLTVWNSSSGQFWRDGVDDAFRSGAA